MLGLLPIETHPFLQLEGREPDEVLASYDSAVLKIHGNSSKLAPWHAKLGFQRTTYVCALRSLTPDGGIVAALDVVVDKVNYLFFDL